MNKLFRYILAFYTLALSAVPCDDVWAISPGDVQQLVVSQSPLEQQDEADHCTVFCSCTCCASITFAQPWLAIPTIALGEFTTSPQFTVTSNRYGTDLGKIWQPPQ